MGYSRVRQEQPVDDLFGRIGIFLHAHRLSPEPEHYAFAHSVLADPAGPLASAVARFTDDGLRLTRKDIEKLGGTVSTGTPLRLVEPPPPPTAGEEADRLVSETRAQVEGFASMVRDIQAEATEFGRDLAISAAAMEQHPGGAGLEEIARLTGAMIARVRESEARLANATHEAEQLRVALAAAQDDASRDPLTGLPNRRAFDEMVSMYDHANEPRCIAICDIDHFKQINDNFGHAVGDRVLRSIAQTLQEACAGHLVVRHGGEEFAVLTRGLTLQRATTLLNDARGAVAAKRFRSRETDAVIGRVTLSGGVTLIAPGEATADALVRADHLLYSAKAGGRDLLIAG